MADGITEMTGYNLYSISYSRFEQCVIRNDGEGGGEVAPVVAGLAHERAKVGDCTTVVYP